MKNRYLLCLLLSAVLLYFAMAKFNMRAEGLEGIFAVTWTLFAFIVVAGNLSALLFLPKRNRKVNYKARSAHKGKRLRSR